MLPGRGGSRCSQYTFVQYLEEYVPERNLASFPANGCHRRQSPSSSLSRSTPTLSRQLHAKDSETLPILMSLMILKFLTRTPKCSNLVTMDHNHPVILSANVKSDSIPNKEPNLWFPDKQECCIRSRICVKGTYLTGGSASLAVA